jgi:hypothetical protein
LDTGSGWLLYHTLNYSDGEIFPSLVDVDRRINRT